jgi:hypothetical protein
MRALDVILRGLTPFPDPIPSAALAAKRSARSKSFFPKRISRRAAAAASEWPFFPGWIALSQIASSGAIGSFAGLSADHRQCFLVQASSGSLPIPQA